MTKKSLIFILFSILVLSELSAKTLTSNIKYREIEHQVKLLNQRYLAFEKLLKEVKYFSNRPLKRTGLNISFIKSKKVNYRIKAIEVKLNAEPVFSQLYSDVENTSLDMGGRQLLFEGDLSAGEHLLSVNTFLKPYKDGSDTIKKNEVIRLAITEDMIFFIEVILSEQIENEPVIRFNQIGNKRGIFGILK